MRNRRDNLERRFCAICEEPYSTAPSDPYSTCSPECEEEQMADMRAKMIAASAPVATPESACDHAEDNQGLCHNCGVVLNPERQTIPARAAVELTPIDPEYYFENEV